MAEHAWRFGVLGPIHVLRDGAAVQVKSQKQRALLGMLLLDANHVVGIDTIIDGLWGEAPPASALATVQMHVANLRKALGSSAVGSSPIATRPPGYMIEVEPDAFDLVQFAGLVRRGRGELERDKPSEASALLGRALECWRGRALADVAEEPFAQSAVVRLEEDRLSALADRIDADLARGAHSEVTGELREITAAYPLRERFWEQLVLALYRCGNQAAALAAFQTARTFLLDELGLEPGTTLRELETAVLDQSPSLDWSASYAFARSGVASTVFEDAPAPARARLEYGAEQVPVAGRVTIGRHPESALVLDDVKVSRAHAVIRPTPSGFLLIDLHSTNGTCVNGSRVEEVVLADGDRIVIGSSEVVFRVDES